MKKVFLLLAIISGSLLLNSCGGNDDDGGLSNTLEIGDDSIYINSGFAIDNEKLYGDGESYSIDLLFLDNDEYTYEDLFESDDLPTDVNGFGLFGYSDIENRLSPGNYEFNNSASEFTFEEPILIVNGEFIDIDSGTFEVVSSSTGSYELNFEGIDEDGNEVYFEFDGDVNYFLRNEIEASAKFQFSKR